MAAEETDEPYVLRLTDGDAYTAEVDGQQMRGRLWDVSALQCAVTIDDPGPDCS